jgi:elongation factor P
VKANSIRRGQIVVFDGAPCRVLEFQHRTPGNLRAFVQVRLRNLIAGNTLETRFSATEEVETALLLRKELQLLYVDSAGYHVMDAETYEQSTLDEDTVGDAGRWLEPDMTFFVEWLDNMPVSVEPPPIVELTVTETSPPFKGATKSANNKPAVLSNGVTVRVPDFVNVGTRIRVDTSDGSYLDRVE